jgi:polyphosphate kinase 2
LIPRPICLISRLVRTPRAEDGWTRRSHGQDTTGGADDVGRAGAGSEQPADGYTKSGKLKSSVYEEEMSRLQEQLVLLQYWIASQGLKVLVIFEGRGSAGKGGVIKRITERTSPRTVRVVALPKPTERQRTQWYFQRYVEHLPAAGEMVMFDRSWYNRSNVEWVMNYCTEDEHAEFLRSCPEFERMLVRSGITVLKYWFSVSFDEQRKRFEERNAEPLKRWKLSDMDLAEHELYVRYSMAKDTTFQYTDIKQAPWFVVPSDDKRASRLNCISHLLSQFEYVDVAPEVVQLPTMREMPYVRPPMHEQTFVPRRF